MLRAFPPHSRIFLATAILLVGAAPALAEPAFLKLGDIKGESTDDKHKEVIEIESFSWGAAAGQAAIAGRKAGKGQQEIYSSDPEEGGEVTPSMASSDPEEGGEVASAAKPKPKLSDIPVVKSADKATPMLRETPAAPVKPLIPRHEVTSPRDVATGQASGKRQHQPIAMTRGSVTVTMPEGVCIAGAHYPAVTLQSGSQVYQLQDVTVASCAPTTAAKGKKADKAKLDYMIVKMETVLVTG